MIRILVLQTLLAASIVSVPQLAQAAAPADDPAAGNAPVAAANRKAMIEPADAAFRKCCADLPF